MKKDEIVEYLKFICRFSDEQLSKDIIDNSNVIYINNEVNKLIQRLKKSKNSISLIRALRKSKIKVTGGKKEGLFSVILILLFGWMWGAFLNQEKARQRSERLKEEIKVFKAKIIDIVSEI
jgi:hypothetical protein